MTHEVHFNELEDGKMELRAERADGLHLLQLDCTVVQLLEGCKQCFGKERPFAEAFGFMSAAEQHEARLILLPDEVVRLEEGSSFGTEGRSL